MQCIMASLVKLIPHDDGEGAPDARSGSCVTVLDGKFYVWGGHTQLLLEDPERGMYPVEITLPSTEDNFFDVYDLHKNQWQRLSSDGDVPDVGNGSTMVGYRHFLYLFGGWNEGDFSSDLYCFDTHTSTWKLVELSSDCKPSPRYLTDAVVYGSNICVVGGVGRPTTQPPPAQYIEFVQYDHHYGFGWNNDMYLFDVNKSKCQSNWHVDMCN